MLETQDYQHIIVTVNWILQQLLKLSTNRSPVLYHINVSIGKQVLSILEDSVYKVHPLYVALMSQVHQGHLQADKCHLVASLAWP